MLFVPRICQWPHGAMAINGQGWLRCTQRSPHRDERSAAWPAALPHKIQAPEMTGISFLNETGLESAYICLLHQSLLGASQDVPSLRYLYVINVTFQMMGLMIKPNEGSGSSGKSQRSFRLHALVTWLNLSLTLGL